MPGSSSSSIHDSRILENGFTQTLDDKMHMKNSLGKYQTDGVGEIQIGAALASKKMQLIEEEQQRANGIKANGYHKAPPVQQQAECEEFQDTQTLGPHNNKSHHQSDEEPIVIFDTQNNTSIAQTARDQFAAALLRLQSGLDVSGQRLDAIETKVDDLVRQQRQQASRQQNKSGARGAGTWASALLGEGKLGTLLYLSWPILVFVAMRTIERRNLLNKLS